MLSAWALTGEILPDCGCMSFDINILRGGLLALLLVAAMQDVRNREVSNLITVPLFLLGIMGVLLSGNLAMIVVAGAVVVAAKMNGGYGAADAKILIGLAGLWPETILPSLLVMLILDWHWRRSGQGDAPLVVAILIGALFAAIWGRAFANIFV